MQRSLNKIIQAKKYQAQQSKRLSKPKNYSTIQNSTLRKYRKSVSYSHTDLNENKEHSPGFTLSKSIDLGQADIRSGKFSKSFYGNLNHYSLDESKMKDTLTRSNLTGKPNNEGKKEAIQNAYLPFSRTRQKSSVEELMRVNHHSLDTLDDTKRNTIHSELSYGSRNRYAAPGLLKNKKNISKSQQKMHLSQEPNQAQRRSPKEVSCRSKNLMPTIKLKHLSNLPNSSMKNGNMKVKDVISKEVGSKLLKSKALSSIQLKKWKNFLKEKKRVKNNL